MPGYLTSIRLTENGISLLVALKNKFINAKTCADKFDELRNEHTNGALEAVLTEFFKNRSVMASYGNHRVYKIDSIAWKLDVTNHVIKVKNGEVVINMTLEEYYEICYGLKIDSKRRNYPLLISKREKDGEVADVHLIMEFCFITGIEDNLRKDESFTKNITSKTKLGPSQRMEKIKQIKALLYKKGDKARVKDTRNGPMTVPWPDEVREEWGLDVGEFMNLSGRVLPNPNIKFANNNPASIKNGKFSLLKSTNPVNLERGTWCAITSRYNNDNTHKAVSQIISASQQFGLVVEQPEYIVYDCNKVEHLIDLLQEEPLERFKILFIVLDDRSESWYSNIKSVLVEERGIQSQMALRNNFHKGITYFGSILNQMLVKMGGIPFTIRLDFDETVVNTHNISQE
jgi:hypothetical protein